MQAISHEVPLGNSRGLKNGEDNLQVQFPRFEIEKDCIDYIPRECDKIAYKVTFHAECTSPVINLSLSFIFFSLFTKIRSAALTRDKLTGRLAAHLSHKRIEFKTTNPKKQLLQIRF